MVAQDEDREVYEMQWSNDKVMAVDALARIGDERAIDLLVKALSLESWHLRNRVVKALESVGKPAVERLIKSLKSGQWYVREGASVALGNIGDVRAIEPLLELLSDKNRSVTEAAKKAISQISSRHSPNQNENDSSATHRAPGSSDDGPGGATKA
ncbi:HEAT repeat domain-containing protein [candidate division KSB1 bacterium]